MPTGRPAVIAGLTPAVFARLVADGAASAPPTVADLTISPPIEGRHVVIGRMLRSRWGGVTNEPFELVAPIPFIVPPPPAPRVRQGPLAALLGLRSEPPATQPQTTVHADVRAFLATAAPSLPYRYRWWEASDVQATFWIGTPTLALGVVLPLALWALRRAGLIATPEPEPISPKARPKSRSRGHRRSTTPKRDRNSMR